VAARLAREVHPGDKCELGELAISVLEAERFRVRWVLVTLKPPAVIEDDTVGEERETAD
jgi:hypothetical protein